MSSDIQHWQMQSAFALRQAPTVNREAGTSHAVAVITQGEGVKEMSNASQISRQLFMIPVLLLVWIIALGWLGRKFEYVDLWGIMLIGAALITFFGFLRIPGSADSEGNFSESRIRLAAFATVLVVYIVYFGSAVYLNPTVTPDGKELKTYASELFPTLTNLLGITIAFYFGSSAAVSIAKKKEVAER